MQKEEEKFLNLSFLRLDFYTKEEMNDPCEEIFKAAKMRSQAAPRSVSIFS